MSMDQMILQVKNTTGMRPNIIAQIKSVCADLGIKERDIFPPKPKKPLKYYCEEIEAGWTGYGDKPNKFGDRNPKDYPINDEDAERIANLTGRDVLTVTMKCVKFTNAE